MSRRNCSFDWWLVGCLMAGWLLPLLLAVLRYLLLLRKQATTYDEKKDNRRGRLDYLQWAASITYKGPLGVKNLPLRKHALLRSSEPFFDRFLTAMTRGDDCCYLFVMK